MAENEPILITFGQPRVGNEKFAKNYMRTVFQVYRIENFEDIVSIFPPIKKFEEHDIVIKIKLIKSISDLVILSISAYSHINELNAIMKIPKEKYDYEFARRISKNYLDDNWDQIKDKILGFLDKYTIQKLINKIPFGYCHIGGLYVLNDEKNKFYHCKDVFNENIISPLCKNWEVKFGHLHDLPRYFNNHNYFTSRQRPMDRCQENKILKYFYNG